MKINKSVKFFTLTLNKVIMRKHFKIALILTKMMSVLTITKKILTSFLLNTVVLKNLIKNNLMEKPFILKF